MTVEREGFREREGVISGRDREREGGREGREREREREGGREREGERERRFTLVTFRLAPKPTQTNCEFFVDFLKYC